ncbi:MAG TPA: hypothetical protein PKD54_03470 [Pirellulaceae bacterium]|nr:hypothetical protein [Pirellulaceae bacterium]
MANDFTEHELEAYLEETLDPARAAQLERAAAADPRLIQRLSYINSRRNAGVHTLGEIWRRNQIAVPSREAVSDWLDGRLNREEAEYLQFRLDILKCRYTQALVDDVRQERETAQVPGRRSRHNKLFQKGAEWVSRRKSK